MDSIPNVWVYIRLVDFLRDNRYMKEAEEVAAMGRSDFPNETGIYNLSGELYKGMGKKEDAKKWYLKVLEIDPKDDFAKNALEEINN
jgi:tetratricopeptide (TPR) repeat protein